MPLTPPKKNRPLPPAGTTLGRLVQIIDLGTHDEEYQGESKGPKRKVRLAFELPTEKAVFKEGQPEEPFMVGKEFTFSMHEKSRLLPFVTALEGGRKLTKQEAECYDLFGALGKACLLNIEHNDGYANLASASPLLKNMEVPPQINRSVTYSIDQGEGGQFKDLPSWIQDKIRESAEYKNPVVA